jgi:hypothetical protein
MKRCSKCGQMHDDSVLTCDCGQPLTMTQTEEAKHRKSIGATSPVAQQNPSRVVSGTPASLVYAPYASNVTLTAIDIPFWDLMSFMFKFTFAALPAVFAATIVWMILLGILSALFGGSLLALLLR